MFELKELFMSVTWSDFLDIAVVSFIIYKFFDLIQGTKATQMVIGVASLSAIYWLSINFELSLLNWVLQHFFKSLFLILVILFQEQIRSALSALGKGKISFRGQKARYQYNIDEIVKATTILGSKKQGGLIVIERNDGLWDYSKTGRIIDANINSELMVSLFHPSSSMHDGAMILFQGKIQSVGALLPLSDATNRKHFGTRHLAAMGLSEICDALVIVVSEETGNVSLFENGKNYYLGTPNELFQHLNRGLNMKNDLEKKRVA